MKLCSSVIYTSDGHLSEINAGFYCNYDNATDEVKKRLTKRLGLITAAADEFAKENGKNDLKKRSHG